LGILENVFNPNLDRWQSRLEVYKTSILAMSSLLHSFETYTSKRRKREE
jgi:hypothetical protein